MLNDMNSQYGHGNTYLLKSDFFGNITMAFDRNPHGQFRVLDFTMIHIAFDPHLVTGYDGLI